MKLTKKLIPAFAMLLVSAVLMSTASFAWFAMRDTVTATGMTVTASSDVIFLEISKNGSDYSDSADADVEATLLPSAPEAAIALNTLATPASWYYETAAAPGASTAASGTKKSLEAGNFADHVYVVTYKVRVYGEHATDGANLHVSEITLPKNTGISVIIAGADGFQKFTANADNDTVAVSSGTTLSNTVTTTAQDIKVYIYIDGTNASVYSNNVTALTGDISFKLTASPAQPAPQQ